MRPSILLGFWRVHKARRHVIGNLQGFVTQWHAQGHAAAHWDDPMALGFLVTLITRLAQQSAGLLDADTLGGLQSDIWGALTGLPPEPLGERVVLLSAAADPRFLDGSRRALVFEAALEAADRDAPETPGLDDAEVGLLLSRTDGQRALFDLWDRLQADSADG